jgi:alpha,alpha-trehalase
MDATNNAPNRNEVQAFVAENFAMQDELENATLSDWTENPSILKSIEDPIYRKWLKNLNLIWKKLAKKINPNLLVNIDRHSLIYVDNTFIIPGGRFKGEIPCAREISFQLKVHQKRDVDECSK